MEELEEVLSRVGAKRMVVGHTPQIMGINAAIAGDFEVRCHGEALLLAALHGVAIALQRLAPGADCPPAF